MNEPCQAVKESQVSDQQQQLAMALDELEELTERLEQRLTKVLRISIPSKPQDDSPPQDLVQFAHEILMNREKVIIVNERIRDMYERIEL